MSTNNFRIRDKHKVVHMSAGDYVQSKRGESGVRMESYCVEICTDDYMPAWFQRVADDTPMTCLVCISLEQEYKEYWDEAD